MASSFGAPERTITSWQRCHGFSFVPYIVVLLTVAAALAGCGQTSGKPSPGSSDSPLQLSDTWATRKEMEASPWHSYLKTVYANDLTPMTFPFSLLQLHMFHTSLLQDKIYKSLSVRQQPNYSVEVVGRVLLLGDLYRLWGGNAPNKPWDQFNIWRCIYPIGSCLSGPVYNHICTDNISLDYIAYGLPAHSKVEVTHRIGDPAGSGMWFYWAKGSGVYFDLRKTAVYRDHQDLAKVCSISDNYTDVLLTQCGAQLGYDSIQFTHHNEGIFKYEILDTRITRNQTNGCPDAKHAGLFSHGWGGAKPCVCDGSKDYLNCDGNSSVAVRNPQVLMHTSSFANAFRPTPSEQRMVV